MLFILFTIAPSILNSWIRLKNSLGHLLPRVGNFQEKYWRWVGFEILSFFHMKIACWWPLDLALVSKTTLAMDQYFCKSTSGAIWQGQINYRDITSALPELIATEHRKRKPFVLGRVFLVLGLLIFVGSVGTIFYNISNALNWLRVAHPCTNFKFNPLSFILLTCIALKHPGVAEGQASLSWCYSLGSFGTGREGPLSFHRPALMILLQTSALLTPRAERLSAFHCTKLRTV